jgi:hypothetical protein
MKRSSIQRTGKGLKRSGTLSRGSGKLSGGGPIRKKPRSEEQKEIDRMTRDADRRFCEQLWKDRKPYSEVSGTYIGPEPNWACVHHLLPKSKYPVYRYEDWNVILLTIQEHADTENGNLPEEVKRRTELAKQRHNG